jgi:glutaredoxin-like protein NrdH
MRVQAPHIPSNTDRKNQLLRTITIYSRPSCQPCRAVKRWWDRKGVTYQEVNVEESPDDLAAIKALGYDSVPVIVVSNGDPETDIHWQGLVLANLEKYTTEQKVA